MKFYGFAKGLQEIEKTSSRTLMTEILVDLLKKLDKDEVSEAMYLMQGRVVPKFVPLEFNFAAKLMLHAVSNAFGKKIEDVRKLYKQKGDLGFVVERLNKKRNSKITVMDVYKLLYDMAKLEGKGSQEGKVNKTSELIKKCDSLSSRYVTRMILGKIRLGLSDKTVLDALSIYSSGDKTKRDVLDLAYGVRSDIGYISELVIRKGIEPISKMKSVPGIPIASMLCEREATLDKIVGRLPDGVVQPKYDGLRCQVHYSEKEIDSTLAEMKQDALLPDFTNRNVRIFSRNLEDMTRMFPDIVSAVEKLGLRSVILDGEVIGVDKENGGFIPFQKTMHRKRKYEVKKTATDIPVKLFAFDILHLNGVDLIKKPLGERLEVLRKVLKGKRKDSIIEYTPTDKIRDEAGLERTITKYIGEGLEGIIAKDAKGEYEPGKRGFNWIKLKKSERGHLVDEVDAIVLGYYRGRGVRARFGIGALLIGVLNQERNIFETIAKIGTGIKDEEWVSIRKRLDKIKSEKRPKDVDVLKELEPDVWVKPELTVVVKADEITRSSSHTAGKKKERGFSLRFPRLVEFGRKDKDPEDITTVEEIEKLFKMQ